MSEEEIDESIIEIDDGCLDREWLKQPKLFMKYAME